MTWKTMAPAEVCDIMDFWIGQTWPLPLPEVHRLAIDRFGWSTDEDGDLVNSVSDLTIPDVFTILSGDQLASLEFRVTDVIRDVTAKSTEFLGDHLTLLVREGTSRWGKPSLSDSSLADATPITDARWDVTGGGRVSFSRNTKSITAEFETPDTAERERELGDR